MSMRDSYLVIGFDANHQDLDTDTRREGYPTEIVGARELIEFCNATKRGVLHDWDAETHTSRLVAYWVVYLGGIAREVWITPTGQWSTRMLATMPECKPGCREPRPTPTLAA